MSFYNTIKEYNNFDFSSFAATIKAPDIERILRKDKLSSMDFLSLLTPSAQLFIEDMARRAQQATIQYFGRTIQLFMPLYISNHCSNQCIYCGFNRTNDIDRKKLSLEEIEDEASEMAKSGISHVLVLTGEAPHLTPTSYLVETIRCLRNYFSSVSIEIFPMDEGDYRLLQEAGADGLTLYQEVYDQKRYQEVHLSGKKTDYLYRLDAPERGARAGFRMVSLGGLLGLHDPMSEVFFTGLHGRYIEDNYIDTEVGLSLPRFNPAEGDFTPAYIVDDTSFVQYLCALRLFMPRSGITVSTRESAEFRNNILPLGVTRYSAGSCTGVGGYVDQKKSSTPQFEITDGRSVQEVVAAIAKRGYQPVYKDWDKIA